MKTHLAEPVVLGSHRLAPTTELAGLADLAETSDPAERLRLLCEIAAAVRAEDAARDHIRALRRADAGAALPARLPARTLRSA